MESSYGNNSCGGGSDSGREWLRSGKPVQFDLGQVANFFTSLFGGSGVQSCYNAQIIEIGGIIVALIGLVVIFAGNKKSARRR